MNKLFFIKHYFLPTAFFSLVINLLLLAPSLFMFQLYDRVLGTRSKEALWLMSALLLLALLVMGIIEIVRSRILVNANNAMDLMLAPFLLKKMVEGATSPEGNPNTHALKDLQSVRSFLTGPGIIQLLDAPWLPIYMVILYMMHPLMLYNLIFGSLLMASLSIASEFLTKSPLAEANSANRLATRFVDSAMLNAEVVNAMGMQNNLIRRWASLNDQVIVLQSHASKWSGRISGMTKFVRQLFQAMGSAVGMYIMLVDTTFSMGFLMAGGIIFGKALGPLEYLISGWRSLLETRAAYTRLDAFVKGSSQEKPNLLELPPPTGQISMEHVTFGIRATGKILIRDVSFSLVAGDSLGIVGPSASGKSTLARLLVGAWKPQQGVIRIDGADLANWPSDRIGEHIGYLPQDIELFAGSIADNIARLDEPDSEMVIEAAKIAGLHEIILQMPNGYDTQIGEGGTVLSGGQRQRVGFARALYGNPKILILDEPNASLDTAGETALVNAMAHLKAAGTTTIFITHNPHFINNVSKLLVMQNGSLAAFGPKEWVMAQLNKATQQAQVSA
ncbi:MAG: type I secretion system permease/ATPase [Desulfuromonadaceae bacterium]|nr:type I secretion system permease/ATPase [Desulfuromonadaceae bacterium]MDD2853910.1 type I secretion system permease/ATPase [Desulfuromonadaceae bacterium]